MGPGQGELCIIVREGGRTPHRCRMARPAVRRDSTCDVIGVRNRSKLRFVTRIAVCRCQFKIQALVARCTRHCPVGSRKRKARKRIVVKACIPSHGCDGVTLLTVRRKPGRRVVGVGAVRKVGTMTTNAGRGGPDILIMCRP
jgi:hypothetical protein